MFKIVIAFLFTSFIGSLEANDFFSQKFDNGLIRNESKNVTVGSVCYRLTNDSNTTDYFIPVNSASDFNLFLENKPAEIKQGSCVMNCVGLWGSCISGIKTYFISVPASGGGVECPHATGDTGPCGP